ncbi:transposable element Tcb2 transposase [Trichonephila clavipes]|nr:transposable element Tcb2 transposase [Trichonephila clavipes]
MDKLPDLDTFDCEQIVGARLMGHSISEMVRQLGFSRLTVPRVCHEYMDGGQKTSNGASCKGQLALTVRGERRLRCIGHCLESLVSVSTFLNAIRYVELLGDHHPFMSFCNPHGNGVLRQENCTSHKSWWATGCLDEHSSDFSVLNLSPRSPELNPIENLWDVLEQGVKAITQHQ